MKLGAEKSMGIRTSLVYVALREGTLIASSRKTNSLEPCITQSTQDAYPTLGVREVGLWNYLSTKSKTKPRVSSFLCSLVFFPFPSFCFPSLPGWNQGSGESNEGG